MASWIKMRCNLWDDSHVVTARRILGSSTAAVIGGLFRLWSVADEQTVDGKLPGYTGDDVDQCVGIKGFAAALVEVGWLQVGDGYVVIPDFLEHNASSAKSRALTAKRVSRFRTGGAGKQESKPTKQERKPGNRPIKRPEDEAEPKQEKPDWYEGKTDREVLSMVVQRLQQSESKVAVDEYGFEIVFKRPSVGRDGLYEADTLVVRTEDVRKLRVV